MRFCCGCWKSLITFSVLILCMWLLLLPAPILLEPSFYPCFTEISLSKFQVIGVDLSIIHLLGIQGVLSNWILGTVWVQKFLYYVFNNFSPSWFLISPFGTLVIYMMDLMIDIHIFLTFFCNFPSFLFFFLEVLQLYHQYFLLNSETSTMIFFIKKIASCSMVVPFHYILFLIAAMLSLMGQNEW